MVGTRKLARLLAHAEAARAKVVLVGDPCQLPEIDAGGAFRSLQHRLGASRLIENRRQTQAWERDALAELRAGDTDSAIDAYLQHERIHQAPTNDKARELLVEQWMSARAVGRRTGSWLLLGSPTWTTSTVEPAPSSGTGLARSRPGRARGTRASPKETTSSRCATTTGSGCSTAPEPPSTAIDIARRHIVALTDNDRAVGDPVRVRRRRSPDPRIRHHHPQGPRRHGRPMLRARRRDRLTGTRLHRRVPRAARQRPLRRRSRPPQRGAPRSRSAARSARRPAGRSAAQLGAALRPRRAPSRQHVAARPAPARTRPATGSPQSAAARPLVGRPDPHRGAPARTARPRRRLPASRRCSARPRPTWPHRQTHPPARRREIEDRIARFDAEIVRHDVKLADLDRQLEAHTPAVAARTTWERQHGVELQRLHDLDRNIELIERLDHVATRRLERGAERRLGIEL